MLQPFDVLKTRLQDPGKHEPRSLFKVFTGLVKKEGISSLWRGTTPTLLRSVPGIAIYFTSLEIIEGSFNPDRSSKILSFLASAFSRTTAGLAVMPFTVMKTRLESGKFTYSSILGGLGQIYRHEGLRGFTYGLLPTLLRDIPYSGIYYVLYNAFKSLAFGESHSTSKNISGNFLCGMVAGLTASTITHPPDVLKTYLQLEPKKYPSMKLAIPVIYKEYGLFGFFQGFVPRMLRRTFMAALSWSLYEEMLRRLSLKTAM
ncbi:mitochondrial glycine transporter-like isoform X2 [Artemia franciscana]